MVSFHVIFVVLFVAVVSAKNEIYDGHSLIEFNIKDANQSQIFRVIEKQLDLDVWSHAAPGRPGQILISKEEKEQLFNIFFAAGIPFEVKVENIKELIDLEEKLLKEASSRSTKSESIALPLNQIYTYDEVDEYLERLAATYPEVVTLVNAGKSIEGRDIKYIKLSTTNFEDTSKPIVFIESLLHSREWATLPATLYAIEKLVIDVTEQDLIQEIDWIILPVANPDGYAHTHGSGRFWRKNRSPGNIFCSGVDLNRNFDINWSLYSSNSACAETYHGSSPFSEPETATISNIFSQYSNRIELFLDIHSFGSMILYGYGDGTLPANGLLLHLLGVRMAQAIDAVKFEHNIDYIVGNVVAVLYEASGSAQDYAQSIGIPYSYTYELPGARNSFGLNGFLVDAEFIPQVGFETWEGIKAGARYARDNYRPRG